MDLIVSQQKNKPQDVKLCDFSPTGVVVKKAEVFHNSRRFLLRMAKIRVTKKLTVFLLAKGGKRVYNKRCIGIIQPGIPAPVIYNMV